MHNTKQVIVRDIEVSRRAEGSIVGPKFGAVKEAVCAATGCIELRMVTGDYFTHGTRIEVKVPRPTSQETLMRVCTRIERLARSRKKGDTEGFHWITLQEYWKGIGSEVACLFAC